MTTSDDPPRSRPFTNADLDRLIETTFVEEVEFHPQIDSTNTRALQLAREGRGLRPLLVLAESQTAGRGRGANRWWARSGALTFSLLLDADQAGLSPRHWPRVSLTVGLAVCEAIASLGLPGGSDDELRIKWPNDVYLRGRKLCGVLLEAPPGRCNAIVLGIGVNVNNSMRHAPPEVRDLAVSLSDAAAREFALAEVLQRILTHLAERLSWVGSRDAELQRRWKERCLLTGRRVRVDAGARVLEGTCRGIDEDGALLLATSTGVERCFAGVVQSF